MKTFFTIVLVLFSVLLTQQLAVAASDDVSDEDSNPTEADCRLIDGSCTVKFLESLLCNYRPHLCISEEQGSQFSWGLLASAYANELDTFTSISPSVIDASGATVNDRIDFIRHEILIHMICTHEGDECPKGSFYQRDDERCHQEPQVCSTD